MPDSVLKIVEEAIQAEIAANRRYLHGAEIAQNERAKQLFLQLAKEEQRHKERLQEQYMELAGKAWEAEEMFEE
jgi:rubrerythrin